MLTSLKTLWKQNKLVTLAFGIMVCVTLFFAFRMVASSLYWSDPDHQNQAIAGWMSPRYIALSYGLDNTQMQQVLGVDPTNVSRTPLKTILEEQNVTLQDVQQRLDAISQKAPLQ